MLSNLGCIGIKKGPGGPRHKPGPDVDAGILANMFQKHREAFRDFGFYEHISRSQACNGAGLVLAFELLDDLLEVCPTGDMPAKACKDAILALVIKKPDLNRTIYNSGIFAGQRCERLGVMLNHLRRLAREPQRFKQAAMVLNGEEVSKLTALVKKVQVTPDLSTAQGLASGLWTDDEATVLAEDHEATAPPRRRLLKKTTSDVSVDSDGFPRILSCARSSSKGIEVDEDGFPAMLGFDDWSEDVPISPPAKKMRAKGSSLEVDSEGYPLLLMFMQNLPVPSQQYFLHLLHFLRPASFQGQDGSGLDCSSAPSLMDSAMADCSLAFISLKVSKACLMACSAFFSLAAVSRSLALD